ncbi:MAG: glycosyltransferase family 2 protein [Candidatus Bipolaricaulia bacterium]
MITRIKISVVIPIFSEEATLPVLYERLIPMLEQVAGEGYEVIFVDDGSTDRSPELLQAFHQRNPRVKIIRFSRNFGHQAALTAGMRRTSGQAVVLMDGDLQDPPEFIPEFVRHWQKGYQVVYAVRRRRKEHLLKRFLYWAFYRLLAQVGSIRIPLETGDFCLLDRRVVGFLNAMPERDRFLRGLRSFVGFAQIGVEYERERRFAGKPKYTFGKLLKLAMDGLVSFSNTPLRLAIWLGFSVAFFAFIGILVVLYHKFISHQTIPGWASVMIAVLFLGAVQLFTIGVLGEYVGRIFEEVKERPYYVVAEELGFDESGD